MYVGYCVHTTEHTESKLLGGLRSGLNMSTNYWDPIISDIINYMSYFCTTRTARSAFTKRI